MTRTYRVYFRDGNQKLYEAVGIGAVCRHIMDDVNCKYSVSDIVKIEEV